MKDPKKSSKWIWQPCIYDIKQSYPDRDYYWNMSPYFMIAETKEDVKI